MLPPSRPALDEAFETQPAHDLRIRCVIQQAHRRPVLVETTNGKPSLEDLLELVVPYVVIPDVTRRAQRTISLTNPTLYDREASAASTAGGTMAVRSPSRRSETDG